MAERTRYLIEVELLPASRARDDWQRERWSAPEDVRLAFVLKELLRRHGCQARRCEEVSPVAQEVAKAPSP